MASGNRTLIAPDGRLLFVQGTVTIEDDLEVRLDARFGNNIDVDGTATIQQDLLVNGQGQFSQNVVVDNNLNVGNLLFTEFLESNTQANLNTQTNINDELNVTGNTNVSGLTNFDGITVFTGETYLSENTFISGNLEVNGVSVQSLGSNSELIETYYGNLITTRYLEVTERANIDLLLTSNIQTDYLEVNQQAILNNETFINGNLFVNGVQTQNIGNANNTVENIYVDFADINDLVVNNSTLLENNVTVQGGTGQQNIGTGTGSRVDAVWTADADAQNLEVQNRTELNTETNINGDLTVRGDGTQSFGNISNRMDEYFGIDMDLSGDLFMLDENKKDFLDLEVQYVFYVKKNGDDSRSGTNLSNAVQTVRRGLELAREFRKNNPVSALDENTTTVMVSVYPGVYVEDGNLEVPENAAVVSSGGQYITELHASDECRRNFRNMFWLNSGSYVQGFSFRNQQVDSFDDPTGGFAYAFAPGANIRRSPYVRDSSQLSNYDPQQLAAPLDPARANPAVGRGGGMILADRRILNPNTVFPYILAFGATPRSPNGVGYVARDGAGINGISSLGIFQRICFYALNGGQVTLNNSGTQFGDISMRSKGNLDLVREAETQANITANAQAASTITTQSNVIVNAMWDDLVANANVNNIPGPDGTSNTSWDSGLIYDEARAERDVGLIVDGVTYDLALNTNYNSIIAGQAFRRTASSKIITVLKEPTLSSIEYVRDRITGGPDTFDSIVGLSITDDTKGIVSERFENILEIISINKTNQIVFNNPPGASADVVNAKDLLQVNRTLIQEDIVEYVDTNFPSLDYDSGLCYRDVGFLVDALSHDILYDGNYASRTSADAYFSGTDIQIAQDETNATIAAYTELQNVVSNVVLGTYPGQETANGIATTSEANTLVSLVEITKTVISDGNTDNLVALVEPDTSIASPSTLTDYNTILANKSALQTDTITYLDTTYANYYENLTKRDARNFIKALVLDLTSGTSMVSASFALGLFGINAQRVFPEYQLDAFVYTWDYMRDEIVDLLGGAGTPESDSVVALVDEVIKGTVVTPDIVRFGSLVESLSHQFNNAGAGVNRNALPLNFRQPGFNRPVPFSILQEDGGRVRWSGADELNNQYFAGGTRINGLTGKFEGRPFNITVRQIARRIANSRGFF